MTINTLSKASKILEDIRLLDEQIVKLDKIVMSVHDRPAKNTKVLKR